MDARKKILTAISTIATILSMPTRALTSVGVLGFGSFSYAGPALLCALKIAGAIQIKLSVKDPTPI